MSTQKEIKVKLIASTSIDKDAMGEWIRDMGFNEYELPTIDMDKGITPSAILIMAAAKRCYQAFDVGVNPNISKVRTDLAEYLDNIFKSGHGSVTEHATFTFAIDNVSRVFTGELNRHRAGVAISEGSMRYIRFDDIGFWMPSLFSDGDDTLTKYMPGVDQEDMHDKKDTTRRIFNDAFNDMEVRMKELNKLWDIDNPDGNFKVKKLLTSAFRRLIGMGVATGGVWTMNVRALRHILALRTTEHAEEEIYHVFDKVADIIVEKEPLLFGDFTKNADTGAWEPKYLKV